MDAAPAAQFEISCGRKGFMPSVPTNVADPSDSLALAIVASSDVPLLLLDGELKVVAASEAFCDAFAIDCRGVLGRAASALGDGEWDIPQLKALLKATAAGLAEIKGYELELRRKDAEPRCLVLNAHKLSYGESEQVRILLAVTDITDARIAEELKEGLLREKATLLKELQHRVANSLQIIASVLMQSARTVNSEETRAHLNDAHNRVMSVAALQKQLSVSEAGDVALKPYFNQLCESIGASMIRDHDQIQLDVTTDDSRVEASLSVSLGLVVTELVINAIKHAFPTDRPGKIRVEYAATGPAWTLKVSDDGIGIPTNDDAPESGLGTSIVSAIAKQLDARITVVDRGPGTTVSLIHSRLSLAGSDEAPAVAAV